MNWTHSDKIKIQNLHELVHMRIKYKGTQGINSN